MNVFSDTLKHHGGNFLPLHLYTSCDDFLKTEEDLVFVDRQSIFDAVRHDSKFPLLVSLLLGGVSPNVLRKRDGATPLHVAVMSDPSKTIPEVVNAHLDMITQTRCSNRLVITFLLDNGADINAAAHQGETPLMVAAAQHNIAALRVLLEKGANVEARDKSGRTVLSYLSLFPLGLAVMKEFLGEKKFMKAGKEENLLHQVCHRAGSVFPALYLVEQLGFDVNAAAHSNASSLGWSTVRDGFTPLHCAVTSGDLELTKALVKAGADIHKTDAYGVSAVGLSRNATVADVRASREDFSPLTKTQHINSDEIRRFFQKYSSTASSGKREELTEPNTGYSRSLFSQLLEISAFLVMAFFPQLILYAFSVFTRSVFLLSVISLGFVALFLNMKQADERGVFKVQGSVSRPLRCFGCFIGFMVSLSILLAAFPSMFYHISVAEQWDLVKTCYYFIFICVIGVTTTLALVVIRSPGFVSTATAPGQRKGIYASLLRALNEKELPRDLKYGVDWDLMLKKPMRAQHCKLLNKLVFRYDGYSAFVASSIGAGNHRPYIYFEFFLVVLLATTYYFTNTHCPSVGRSVVSKEPTTSRPTAGQNQKVDSSTSFATGYTDYFLRSPSHRFLFVFSQVIVPVVLFMAASNLFSDILHIAWNLTNFDMKYADTHSSLYCFKLKNSVYSLYDRGPLQNLKDFFFLGENFRALRYRPPALSDRLKEKVQDFQKKEILLASENQCQCDGHHGHSQHQLVETMGSSSSTPVLHPSLAQDSPTVTVFHEENTDGSVSGINISLPQEKMVVQQLFLELVRSNGSAEMPCPTDVNEDDWSQFTKQATEMYRFFKSQTSGTG